MPRTGRTCRRLAALVLALVVAGPAVVVLPAGGVAARPAGVKDTDGDGLRDGFEIAAGLDPQHRDSDADGLRDPAEDLDGDGLGNLGEQRAGTDPLLLDSDGDTIPDGADDADGDGVRDGREQDRRPVPRPLRPGLGSAYGDTPQSYRDGCHLALGSRDFRVCIYGDRHARTTVVLFGDSHAAQWLPALTRVAGRAGWRIVSFTRSGCPYAVVKVHRSSGSDAPCRQWRLRVLRWIAAHRPEVVVMSSLADYWLIPSSLTWWAGMRRAIRALPGATIPLVLADTPNLKLDVPACLAHNRRSMAACTRARRLATHPAWRDKESAVAVAAGAVYGDLTAQVCPYDPCPVVVDDLLLWRDQGHLTRTYSTQLAPSVRGLIGAALEPPSQPPDPARRSRRRG